MLLIIEFRRDVCKLASYKASSQMRTQNNICYTLFSHLIFRTIFFPVQRKHFSIIRAAGRLWPVMRFQQQYHCIYSILPLTSPALLSLSLDRPTHLASASPSLTVNSILAEIDFSYIGLVRGLLICPMMLN